MRCLQDTARVVLALWLALAPVKAWAGSMMLLGAGAPSAAAPTYQGLGDAVSGATFFRSCARAYTAAYAAGGGSLCEVQRTSDSTKCTMVAATSGFVDLTTANCNANTQTIVQFCNATTCGIDKRVNQANPGTYDDIQATQANQPVLVFSAVNGLPVGQMTTASSQSMSASNTFTGAVPYALGIVAKRTAIGLGGFLSASNATVELRGSSTASTWVFACGSNVVITVTDNQWNGVSGSCGSVAGNSATNINGAQTNSISNGNQALTAATFQSGKSQSGSFVTAQIAEDFFYAAGLNSTQQASVYTNQHGSSGYNGAF